MCELNMKNKHVVVVTDLKSRACQTILNQVRQLYGRKRTEYVSLIEICLFKKIDVEAARARLKKFNML